MNSLSAVGNTVSVFAPGRINIIGSHTDYNDGFVLPAAIDKGTFMSFQLNGTESTVNANAAKFNSQIQFDLTNITKSEIGWANYIMGVVKELQDNGFKLSGFDVEIDGDIPIGSGLSSSASVENCVGIGLNELFGLNISRIDLIRYSQRAENNFVGMRCGIMDQFSSMMGRVNEVMLLDCRTLDYRYFPINLDDYQLILLNTNVSHQLADSEYNTRRGECEQGVEIIKTNHPNVTALRDVTFDMLEEVKEIMPNVIFKRCRHIIGENHRVQQAAQALESGAFQLFGKIIYASHNSSRRDFEISCPQLDFIIDYTEPLDYVLCSRMMGGGFGGCTINFVRQNMVDQFITQISADYQTTFALELTPIQCSIGDGARIIDK